MEIRIDGNRSSSENWMRAQIASAEELPKLSDGERAVAEKLGFGAEAYARSLYASDLEQASLKEKVERAARAVERIARRRVPEIGIERGWLKTFEGKFRFDLDLQGDRATVSVDEEVIDDLLDSGCGDSEERIGRIIDFAVPASWMARAS